MDRPKPLNPNHTRRHRLLGFDYSNPGYYFVTSCAFGRRCCLSRIDGRNVALTPIGRVVDQAIQETFATIDTAILEEYVIMPNHVHMLIYIYIENETVALSDIVRSVKGRSSAEFRRLEPQSGGRLWQKSYMDQIVRNDTHLDQVRRYIGENPIRPRKDVWW